MPFQHTLHHLAYVLQQVKAVGNLHGIRSPTACSIGIFVGAVAGDHLDAGMCLEPLLDDLGGAFWLEINRAMGVKVDEDRTVDLTFAACEVVDAQVAGCRIRCGRRATSEAEERIGADWHPLAPCQPSTRLATNL